MRSAVTHARLDVERLIERDAIDPRSKSGVASKRSERVIHAHHYVLSDVFSLRHEPLTEDRDRQSKYLVAMTTYELGERRFVFRLATPLDQREVVSLDVTGIVRQGRSRGPGRC